MEAETSMLRAMTQLQNQANRLGEAAHTAMQAIEQSLRAAADAAEQPTEPDRFKYTDEDGDSVSVLPSEPDQPEWLMLCCSGSDGDDPVQVRLRQDAINGLAQYLDRHRTDQNDAEPVGVTSLVCDACGHPFHDKLRCGERQLLGTGPYRCACRGVQS